MIALWLALACAEVRVEGEPVQGKDVLITILDDAGRAREGIGVRVVHRPGLRGETQLALGLTDSLGRVRWTPETGGTATLHAGRDTLDLRVVPAALPSTTLTWLILSWLTALGATGFGWLTWRRRARPHRTRH